MGRKNCNGFGIEKKKMQNVSHTKAENGDLRRFCSASANSIGYNDGFVNALMSDKKERVESKMARALTENQMLLAKYLTAIGCEMVVVLDILLELWDEGAVLEMLEFCKNNPNASQAQVMKASSEIASGIDREKKRKRMKRQRVKRRKMRW